MSVGSQGEGRGREHNPALWNTELPMGSVTSLPLLIISGWIKAKILEFSVTAQCTLPNSTPLLCRVKSVSHKEVLYLQDKSLFPSSKKCKWLGVWVFCFVLFGVLFEREMQVIKELVQRMITFCLLHVCSISPCSRSNSIAETWAHCEKQQCDAGVAWLWCFQSFQLPAWKFNKIVLLYYF